MPPKCNLLAFGCLQERSRFSPKPFEEHRSCQQVPDLALVQTGGDAPPKCWILRATPHEESLFKYPEVLQEERNRVLSVGSPATNPAFGAGCYLEYYRLARFGGRSPKQALALSNSESKGK
jgi:hypothetical protein